MDQVASQKEVALKWGSQDKMACYLMKYMAPIRKWNLIYIPTHEDGKILYQVWSRHIHKD